LRHSHSICLIPEGRYSTLYQKINGYLSNGYAVIYGVESGDTDKIIRKMANFGIGVDGYTGSGALSVIDRNSIYSLDKTNLEGKALFGVWISLVSDIRKGRQFKGIAAMGMPEPFFETRNHQKLVEYEQFVSKQQFDPTLEAICCYSQKSVRDLPLAHLVSLSNSHQYSVSATFGYSEWCGTKIIEGLSKGLERMLGSHSSRLAFEAIRHMYKIDEGTVISQPEILEKVITKMFADSAEMIADVIKDEIVKKISFVPENNNLLEPKEKPEGS
jgi:hypothetical protein